MVQIICPKRRGGTGIDLERIISELFGQLLSLMIQGKACCHLENEKEWSWTREKQLERKADYEKEVDRILKSFRKGEGE